jgi:hypothetical protein
MMFRVVFWDILMMEAVRTSETSVDNHFTRQYIPEDNSEQVTIYLVSYQHVVRFQVLTAASMMFRVVFWVILMMEAVRTSETSVVNHFTRQYIPEDNSEHHTRRRENLKSHASLHVQSG